MRRSVWAAAAAGIGWLSAGGWTCAQTSGGTVACPLVALSPGVKIEIAEIIFVTRVDGVDGNRWEITREDDLKKYRGALVTLRITKPAGRTLEIAACDLSLHYMHGPNAEKVEATPCEGISSFNQTQTEERTMKLARVSGPGFVKMATGTRASQASVVYMDALFGSVEPDISKAWICVAQPSQSLPFATTGWKPAP